MSEIDTADVETLFIDDLDSWLSGRGFTVRVADRLPPGETAEGVGVVRVGGPMLDLVTDNPTISVEAKADGWVAAWELIAACRKWSQQLEGRTLDGLGVNFVQEFAGPTRNPTDDSPYRYTVTLSVGIQARIT